jgi:hypothetical protein
MGKCYFHTGSLYLRTNSTEISKIEVKYHLSFYISALLVRKYKKKGMEITAPKKKVFCCS